MCGISAILTKTINPSSLKQLEVMHASIPHRGPDGEGGLSWSFEKEISFAGNIKSLTPGNVLFAHRRLSIIDLSNRAVQPFIGPCGRYSIIYNGEIYNFLELRKELEVQGVVFTSSSDTEVLLKGYEIWGKKILSKVMGMFAFIILDLKKNILFVARDPFGIKPLYYSQDHNGIFFSSEIKSLLTLGNRRKLETKAALTYLRFGITDFSEKTLFQGIYHFPAASYAEIDLRTHKFEIHKYWEPELDHQDISFEEAAKKLRDLFLESLQQHLRGDVPISFALSGGIDSSAIVCGTRYLNQHDPIRTFSYVSSEERINEEKWATLVNQTVGAESHPISIPQESLLNSLDQLIQVQEEPFGSTSIFAQYCVFQRVKQNSIKVVLDGQGADEIFGGYQRYIAPFMAQLIKSGEWKTFTQLSNSIFKGSNFSRARITLQILSHFSPKFLDSFLFSFLGQPLIPAWVNKKYIHDKEVSLTYRNDIKREDFKSDLKLSLTRSILPSLLRYQDRNSMVSSIESRVPFLNPKLVDFVYSLPRNYFISPEGKTKWILREAMKGIVPDVILERKDKIGFSTPQHSWLSRDSGYIDKILNSDAICELPILNIEKIKKTYFGKNKVKNHEDVWRIVNLIKWAEIYQVSQDT